MTVRRVAIAWLRKEDWPRWLELDPDFQPDYEHWLKRMDSLYASAHYLRCDSIVSGSTEASFFFVRDTLLRISAALRGGPALPPLPPGDTVDVGRWLRAILEQYRVRLRTLLGSGWDSVSTSDSGGSSSLRATLSAHWVPNARRAWAAEFTLVAVFFQRNVYVLPNVALENVCAVDVPWLRCRRPTR